jgi:serine/threonine-protein kinase
MELGDHPDAEADFNKAESLPLDSAARYALHLNRGTLHLKEKKPAEAMRQFEQAVQEKPQLYQAHANLAEACGQLDQLDEAVRRLSEAIRLEPNHAGLYRARALLEQRRGRPAAALTDLDEAIRLVPHEKPSLELARYHFERGAILFLSDRFRPALQALDDSLAVRLSRSASVPKAERDRLSANTHLLRAQVLLKLNDYKNARAAFDAYLTFGPATAKVWRQCAAVDLILQDYQTVLEDCSRALGLEQDADSFYLRGCAYLHFHVPKSAVRDFEEALRLRPEHAEARVWRGLARIEIGDIRRGVEDARQAVKQSPRSAAVTWCSARVFARACAAERDSLEYEAEALRLLRQAIELLPTLEEQRAFWSSKVQRDGALSPIRSNAAFQALERRFGQARR